ncbi:fructosamine kinase family protein [Pontimicrobium aquaticum]|uniref:fructosamine kinase family protein n=1 Tax=Pontimicrobium aquaticum TaxID=2565367 RepID=UPI0021CF5656|nr:fructosamine kinase family protein [Pontimicrobium aquaticum]
MSYKSISGGDISSAYNIKTQNQDYFLKVNGSSNASKMFSSERAGLNTIAKTNTIATPKIYLQDSYKNISYILMEYIESVPPAKHSFKKLGIQLAKLHQTKADKFGFNQHNFIGSLQQSNSFHDSWLSFYIEERLIPQIDLAITKRLLNQNEVPSNNKMQVVLDNLLKNKTPSLLHGDLWSGNFLIASNGTPYLIDPACYYGHNEVDIAISNLFGGFDSSFYNAYHDIIPKNEHTNARIELYQLYYLLVHLNLFGGSYYSSVKHILLKYF